MAFADSAICLSRLADLQRINMHRLSNVFQRYRAEIADFEVEPPPDLAIGVLGKTNPARLGDALKPRRYIDPVAHQIAVALLDHVAEMDADTEFDALVGPTSALRSTIALWTSMAQFTASTTLRNSTIPAVAGALDDVPVMHCDGRVDQVAAKVRRRARIRSSSAPASRVYPTTSATRIAASFRVSPIWRPLG